MIRSVQCVSFVVRPSFIDAISTKRRKALQALIARTLSAPKARADHQMPPPNALKVSAVAIANAANASSAGLKPSSAGLGSLACASASLKPYSAPKSARRPARSSRMRVGGKRPV